MAIIMKFGGTSVGTAKSIRNVHDIIKSRLKRKPIVVVSAVGGVTDLLIDCTEAAVKGEETEEFLKKIDKKHFDILNEFKLPHELVTDRLEEYKKLIEELKSGSPINKKMMDAVQSFGERMSCKIVAAYLEQQGIKAEAYYAFDVGMISDDNYGEAEPLPEAYGLLKKNLANLNKVAVVTGFIAKNKAGEITTFGRGGSDYTAAIIGAAVKAEEIQIWTDVSGVLTTDPKIVPEAERIDELSFAEASELAFFGAKVLHPKTIIPAVDNNIPVVVLNTHDAQNPGTKIVKEIKYCTKPVKAIARKKDISLVNITSTRMLFAHGFLAKLFEIFEKYQVSVDMVATSEISVSLTINKKVDLIPVIEELERIANVKVEENKAIVCLVGKCMKEVPGTAGRIFKTLGDNRINIHMISQGASEINVSFVVDAKDADNSVKVLHKEFFS